MSRDEVEVLNARLANLEQAVRRSRRRTQIVASVAIVCGALVWADAALSAPGGAAALQPRELVAPRPAAVGGASSSHSGCTGLARMPTAVLGTVAARSNGWALASVKLRAR